MAMRAHAMAQRLSSVVRCQPFSLNDFFSRTTDQIYFKLSRKHSWQMEGDFKGKERGNFNKSLKKNIVFSWTTSNVF